MNGGFLIVDLRDKPAHQEGLYKKLKQSKSPIYLITDYYTQFASLQFGNNSFYMLSYRLGASSISYDIFTVTDDDEISYTAIDLAEKN